MDNSNIKILLVDDEEDILEFLEYNLRKENYEVLTANNGREALKLAIIENPHLIILDIMMPEMDGIEVCKELRSDKRFDDTVITFLTARSEDYVQVSGLDYGGDDFINKPIKPAIFMSRVKALLRRSTRVQSEMSEPLVIRAGDIVLDEEKHVVNHAGEEIEFPRKEFQLLALLMSKPGKVFTRESIFRKVWGSDVIVGNRTIDVHVRKVREKIGGKYIKTVKGVGYKFEF